MRRRNWLAPRRAAARVGDPVLAQIILDAFRRGGAGDEAADHRPARESREGRARGGATSTARSRRAASRTRSRWAGGSPGSAVHPGRDRREPGGADAGDRQADRPRAGFPLGRDPRREAGLPRRHRGRCWSWCARLDDRAESALLVGHNPGVTELAQALVRGFDAGLPDRRGRRDRPARSTPGPGARRGCGSLRFFDCPKYPPLRGAPAGSIDPPRRSGMIRGSATVQDAGAARKEATDDAPAFRPAARQSRCSARRRRLIGAAAATALDRTPVSGRRKVARLRSR